MYLLLGRLSLVPEKILVLLFFLFGCTRDVYRFARVGVDAGVEHGRGKRHGRRRKILDLLRPVMHFLRLLGELRHVALGATGVRGDEIRN